MNELLSLYSFVPYHNRSHAENVVGNLVLLGKDSGPFMVAGYGHDALHSGTPREGDEIISAKATCIMARIHNLLLPNQFRQTENLILGTIFKNRGSLDGDQVFVADADIGTIGKDFDEFVRNATRLFIENCLSAGNFMPTKEEVLHFWSVSQEGFYTFLCKITNDVDNPFLTNEARKAFPNFPRNRDTIRQILEKNPEFLINIMQSEWKKYFNKPLTFTQNNA